MFKEEMKIRVTMNVLVCFFHVFYIYEYVLQHYLLYISVQYTNNTAVDNFIHKSWLSCYHFLRLGSLELLNQRI